MKIITIDVSGTPPSADVIQTSRAYLSGEVKKYRWIQIISIALAVISLIILTIAEPVFGVHLSGKTTAMVSAIIGGVVMSTLFISAVEDLENSQQLNLLDAVDKSDCVELLRMAEDSPRIKEYCVAVSKTGRQVTKREFNALKSAHTEAIEKDACRKLYLMDV